MSVFQKRHNIRIKNFADPSVRQNAFHAVTGLNADFPFFDGQKN